MYTENMTDTMRARMGNDTDCACAEREHHHGVCESSWGLDGYPVGMVYAPIQRFDRILDLDTALHRGTIFEELDLPFLCVDRSKGGRCNG